MRTIEDILNDYCGCYGPVLNDRTEKFSSSGMEAYEYLKGFISALGDLNILNPDEVIKKMDKIANKYMPEKLSDSDKTDADKLLKITKGKKIHTYNSWNGSSDDIVVENIDILTNSIHFFGTNNWGGKSGIYVDVKCLDELLSKGKAMKHNTIDGCDVKTLWTIN